jgi:hypothetical protein
MRKLIFVGSSREGLEQAEQVCAILGEVKGVEPLLWTYAFANGDITFLRIEELSKEVAGAVFLATPDDKSVIRAQEVFTPRANVLFEYGFLTAALGRPRVALCRYDNVELPSDFQGLTHIPMGPFEPMRQIDYHSKSNLKTWADALPATYAGLPASVRAHGYSGVWHSTVIFSLWRGLEVRDGESVEFNGSMILHVPPNGRGGSGTVFGELRVNVRGCYAEFALSDSIQEAFIGPSGDIEFISLAKTRQRIAMEGEPPQQDGFEQVLRNSREFRSSLSPSDRVGELRGEYRSERGGSLVSKGLEINRKIPN